MVSRRRARLQASKASKQHPTPQTRNSRGKFGSTPGTLDSTIVPALPPSGVDLNAVEKLVDDPSSTFDDKLARTLALHARWQYEDTEEQALGEGEALQARQRARCKELGLIVVLRAVLRAVPF